MTSIGLEHAYFDPETVDQFTTDCIKGLESALDNALVRGKVVKGVVICNPSNPLGKMYVANGSQITDYQVNATLAMH